MPVLYRCTIQIFYIIPAVKSISGNKKYTELQLVRLALERVISKRGTARIFLHNALFRAEDGFTVRRAAPARAVFARGRYALFVEQLAFQNYHPKCFFYYSNTFSRLYQAPISAWLRSKAWRQPRARKTRTAAARRPSLPRRR